MSENNTPEKELDNLLAEMQKDTSELNINEIGKQLKKVKKIVSAEDMESYINRQTQLLLNHVLFAVEQLTVDIAGCTDSASIEAYSKLIASSAQVIEVLNKKLIKDKDNQTKKEITKLKAIQSPNNNVNGNEYLLEDEENGHLVGNRDNVFKQILKSAHKELELEEIKNNTIEAEYVDDEESKDD